MTTFDFSSLKYPVCLFDSGIGGLNVLNELQRRLPNVSFVYVADQKYCPYGIRSDAFVASRVYKITRFFDLFKPTAIVVACNTATRFITDAECKCLITGVVKPIAERALKVTENKKVLLLATTSTINGGLYEKYLADKGVNVYSLYCDAFVGIAENAVNKTDETRDVISDVLSDVGSLDFDTVIFGCTHFDFLYERIKAFFNKPLNFVRCKDAVVTIADELKKTYKSTGESSRFLNQSADYPKTLLLTTGDCDLFYKQATFYGVRYDELMHVSID